MLQTINNKTVYVVEFDEVPETPVGGLTEGEKVYETLLRLSGAFSGGMLPRYGCGMPPRGGITYAQALTHAIETGVVIEPGKYGIHLAPGTDRYEIFRIVEE